MPTGGQADSSSGTSNQNPVIAAEVCYVCNEHDRYNKAVGTLECDRSEKCSVAVDGHFYKYDVTNSKNQIENRQYCSKCVDKDAKLKEEVKLNNTGVQHNTSVLETFVECKWNGCARRAHEKCDRCLLASGKELARSTYHPC